nr:MAG TPA: hypothetical protein [Caudoviricetes sp.]
MQARTIRECVPNHLIHKDSQGLDHLGNPKHHNR